MARTLSAPVTVTFDYTRSVGPTLGRFFTGLRSGVLLAGRLSDGRVVLPPPEHDPVTHAAVTDLEEVGPGGEVVSWAWVPEPVAGQPFDRPFAWVLVRLDGTTAPCLHALDAASPDDVHTGMRVRVRWLEERRGAMTDFCLEPERDGGSHASTPADPVTGIVTPVTLDYLYAASPEESAFFRALAEGRIVGQRCPQCGNVYVPPRGACPADGVPTSEEVELAQTGTVTTFCIVNVPFLGQRITPPYVSAYVLLDGADIAIQHLVLGIPADEVRMGLRVRAVWKPREEWGTTIENISHFEPTGEPDADYETYRSHV